MLENSPSQKKVSKLLIYMVKLTFRYFNIFNVFFFVVVSMPLISLIHRKENAG